MTAGAAGYFMYAIISDIHANLAALEAVLADIENRRVQRVVCLGDVVGYGPDPLQCLSIVREKTEFCLKGNHDVAILFEPLGFNQAARSAAIWTKKQVKPGWFSSREKRMNWEFLQGLPERLSEGDNLFVHGSPRDPVMEYIEESDLMNMGFGPGDKIQSILNMIEGTCFVGHTHRPGIIDESCKFYKPRDFDLHWQLSGKPTIVNVGSVGQPRDADPRACYVTVDGERVEYHRVEYDVELTVRKIRENNELHEILADRLLEGR